MVGGVYSYDVTHFTCARTWFPSPRYAGEFTVIAQVSRLTIFAIEQEKFSLMEARKCLKSPETLDDVVKGLHVLFEDDHVNVEEVISFLSSYRSNPADWAKYANYDPHRWGDDIMLIICVFNKS